MSKSRGFTLIELMIVIAIVAILAAIALPSYVQYVKRGKISDAVATMSDMRLKMEQYFQDNRSYLGSCVVGGTGVAPTPVATQNFSFACPTAPTANAYLFQATGIGSMTGFNYTINQAGTKTTSFGTPNTWSNQNCGWVLKPDGSC